MQRSFRLVGVLLALVLVAGGCGKGKEIGDDNELANPKGGDGALGRATTTLKPPPTTVAPPAVRTTTTRAAQAAPTTAVAPPAAEIYINDDTAGKSIEPDKIVNVGAVVRFVNRHPSPRALHGTRNEFTSPVIQPGSHWDYKTNVVGRIEIEEICSNPDWKCRPYAKGYLTVQGR